jgi:flagellar biosynthesis anti-sigma factor FlgM
MRVNDQNLQGLGGAGAAGLGSTNRTGSSEAVSSGGATRRTEQTTNDGDRIQLSGLSQALQVELEDTPERLAKVDQLREAVQSGTYQPNSAEVSKKLIDESLATPKGYSPQE